MQIFALTLYYLVLILSTPVILAYTLVDILLDWISEWCEKLAKRRDFENH